MSGCAATVINVRNMSTNFINLQQGACGSRNPITGGRV